MTNTLNPRGALGVGIGIIAGWASAAIFSFALAHVESMLVFFAYFAAVPLFVAGFSAGSVGVLTATLAGTLGLVLEVSAPVAATFGFVNALPVLVLCLLALRFKTGADGKTYWYPEGLLTMGLALYPCVAFLVGFAFAHSQEESLWDITTRLVLSAIDQIDEGMEPEMVSQLKDAAPSVARFLPGAFGVCWSVLMIASAFFAQNFLRKERWNLREPFAWTAFAVPTALVFAVAGTGLAAVFAPDPYGYLGLNLCIVLCLPLFIAGLAVVHVYAGTRTYKTTFLVLFYILLSLIPWLVILIALLGAMDQALSIKERLIVQPKQN